jgi:predicted nucleotidyltransferase
VSSWIDLLIEKKKRNQKYFLNYEEYGQKIKQISVKILEDNSLKVLVFGSVVKGTWIPNKSDIDVLVISEKVEERAHWQSELRMRILQELGDLFAPFEIHFATPGVFEDWYRKFIKNDFIEV